jgi:N-ethylmaleimide reductase
VKGWKLVTDAVHAEGGKIFLQLWHVGRISHPDLQPGNVLPVAPSAIAPKGSANTLSGPKPFVTPRALTAEEIPGIIAQYKKGAENAQRAGFDGVEVHGANGYLIDQFLRDGTNKRTDAWGGSLENRARFALEVTKAAVEVWGADRVGIRLSPNGTFNDMADSNPEKTFGYILERLSELNLAYVHLVDMLAGDARHGATHVPLSYFRSRYRGVLVANGGYDLARAQQTISEGLADLISFGQLYISNPDLTERFKRKAPLNAPDSATFYGGGEKGYTDYPAL